MKNKIVDFILELIAGIVLVLLSLSPFIFGAWLIFRVVIYAIRIG